MRQLALAVLVTFGIACSAQEVTVRVFNAKNDQPLASETVKVQSMGGEASSPVLLTTDAKGEAHFSIPNHTGHIDVRVVLKKSRHWDCNCWVAADTKEVRQGIVAYTPVKGREAPAAKPNEIVIMAYPLSFIQRLLWPLMKQ